jgi:hypothetical protein
VTAEYHDRSDHDDQDDYEEVEDPLIIVNVSAVKNNRFKIYVSAPCRVHWLIIGKRRDATIEVEVGKSNAQIRGNGPYQWM